MPNSNKTIFLLKERIRATNLSYRKQKSQQDTQIFINNKKLSELQNQLRTLNKDLKEKEKKISALRLNLSKDGENILIREIKGPLLKELKINEAANNDLNNKLKDLLNSISKEKKLEAKPNNDDKELKKRILKYKDDISNIKNEIQKTRTKLDKLKLKLAGNIKANKVDSSKETIPNKTNDLIIESCDNLYEAADRLVKKNLNMNEFDECRNIFHLILSKKRNSDQISTESKNVFIQNLISNLIYFAENINLNLISNERRLEREKEDQRNIKNDIEVTKQNLDAMVETNRRNSGENVGGASFFVSFSDVISVLLCFFILFFSLGKVDGNKAKRLASTFQEDTIKVNTFNAYVSKKEFRMLEKVKLLLKENVELNSIVEGKEITIDHLISGPDFFPPGEIEISMEGSKLIKDLFKSNINDNIKKIIIEGHTDDKELSSFPEIKNKYLNNLGLSIARASNIAKLIIEYIGNDKGVIGIRGHGSKRPLKPNTSNYFRSLNRRVVIQLIKNKAIEPKMETQTVTGSAPS